MGLRPELPLELLYNVIDICANRGLFHELKALRLVSRSLNHQARKHLWSHISLPPQKATRLDRDGIDFHFLVTALATLSDIPSYTTSLHLASYPPKVLSPFLHKLKFNALRRVSIHGHDSRVSHAPASGTFANLFRVNANVHTLELSNFRMNALAFLDFISQSQLRELRHCCLDIINTTIEDSWDDYISEPKSELVTAFLEKRIQELNVARPLLTSLSLNRITNLPNPAFSSALFGHAHSLFDISSLRELTLCISSYPPVLLWHFNEVIKLCCLSVTSLTIKNWQG